jgi:hypothetical protein
LYQPEFGSVYFAKQRSKLSNNNQCDLTTAH